MDGGGDEKTTRCIGLTRSDSKKIVAGGRSKASTVIMGRASRCSHCLVDMHRQRMCPGKCSDGCALCAFPVST